MGRYSEGSVGDRGSTTRNRALPKILRLLWLCVLRYEASRRITVIGSADASCRPTIRCRCDGLDGLRPELKRWAEELRYKLNFSSWDGS